MRKLLLIALFFLIAPHAHAARLFTGGFENCTATTILDQMTTTGTPIASTTLARSGSCSGTIQSGTSGTAKGFVYQFLAANANGPYFLRYYLYIQTYPNVNTSISSFQALAGTQEANIVLTTTGTLQLWSKDGATQIGSASSVLSKGAWYCVETKVDRSEAAGSQIEQAWVDKDGVNNCGTTMFAGSTAVTMTAAGFINFNLGANFEGESYTTGVWGFDDVAANDSTGAAQTGLPGSGKVIYLRPNAAGDVNAFTSQTGGTAGSANNFTRVNETTPDGATTFNGDNTLSHEDLFNMTDSGIGTSDTVNVVQVNEYYDRSAATVAAFKAEIEKTGSGTKTQSSAVTPVAAFSMNQTAVPRTSMITAYNDPDGSAWTKTTLDSMQVGYIISTAATNFAQISTAYAIVDYTPASTPATVIAAPIFYIRGGMTIVGRGSGSLVIR